MPKALAELAGHYPGGKHDADIPLEWAAHTCRRKRLFLSTGKGNGSHLDFSAIFLGHLVPFAHPWHSLTSHKQCEPHVDSVSEATCPQNLLSQVTQHVLPSQPDNISSSTLFPAVQWGFHPSAFIASPMTKVTAQATSSFSK